MSLFGDEINTEAYEVKNYKARFGRAMYDLNQALKAFDYKEEDISDEELNKNLLAQKANTIKVLQQIISDIEKKM